MNHQTTVDHRVMLDLCAAADHCLTLSVVFFSQLVTGRTDLTRRAAALPHTVRHVWLVPT